MNVKLTDEELKWIVSEMKSRCGIDLSKKRLLIEGRLSFNIQNKGYNSFRSYFKDVFEKNDMEEISSLINKLTTNYTYFNREKEHFSFITNVILPQCVKTNVLKELRIWSSGCSTGQEPFNLVMYLNEYFGSDFNKWDTKILATDISTSALIKARSGIVSNSTIKELSDEWKRKYLSYYDQNNYKVKDFVRNEVIFKQLNLVEPFHFKRPFDLIICRNVMIYFDQQVRDSIAEKYYDVLKPGGYLIIGHAETISKRSRFKIIQPSIYMKPNK